MKKQWLLAATLLAVTSVSQAQDSGDPFFRDFGFPGLYLFPEQPRDFLDVVGIIVNYSTETLDPVPVNDLNLVFDDSDDASDPLPLEVIMPKN